MQTELSQEERNHLQVRINLRGKKKKVLSELKTEVQKASGIAGCESFSRSVPRIIRSAMKKRGLQVKDEKILEKPSSFGFRIGEDGRIYCDLETFQNKIANNEIEKLMVKKGETIENVRFDQCGFPKGAEERNKILFRNQYGNLDLEISTLRTRWLFFKGATGTGKTAKAIRIVWETIKDFPREKATFVNIGPWMKSKNPSDLRTQEEERNRALTGLSTEKLVIIDEFDKFDTMKEFQCNNMFELIDGLIKKDCKVIITSNRSIEEIENNCHFKLLPAMDRIRGKSIVQEFNGKSFR